VAAVCFVVPSATANTVSNNTRFEAYCRESIGKFELVILAPGERAGNIDTYDCAVYEIDGGPYRGCLQHDHRETVVLVSEYQPAIPESECDVGIYPARP
jgi:hypothetical protein